MSVALYRAFWISTKVVYVECCFVVTWLVPCETAAVSTCSVFIIQPCTMSHHFIQSHLHRVHVCSAVICHLHFWQNDRDLLHATAVTQGLNGYWNKSQHKKYTLEKKVLLPGLKPMTFQSWVWHSNHWATPGPRMQQKINCFNSCEYLAQPVQSLDVFRLRQQHFLTGTDGSIYSTNLCDNQNRLTWNKQTKQTKKQTPCQSYSIFFTLSHGLQI